MIFLSLYVFLEASHVEGSSLATSLHYQDLLLFCNQLAFARLVIRRAVVTGNPRFVGCSWFIGLIGLVSELPEIKGSQLNYAHAHPHSSPLASSH